MNNALFVHENGIMPFLCTKMVAQRNEILQIQNFLYITRPKMLKIVKPNLTGASVHTHQSTTNEANSRLLSLHKGSSRNIE